MNAEDLRTASASRTLQIALLGCGVLYALVYAVANDVIAATLYHGYSRLSQAVSELSAKGAPTRPFLAAMLPVFSALMVAFGVGVWRTPRANRSLRVTGGLLVAHGLVAPLWLLAPMSQRQQIAASGGAVNDTMHIGLTVVTIILILSQFGFGAAALGRRFGIYSLITAATVIVSGAITGMQSSKLSAGEATPWLGLSERISIAAWLLWVALLAIVLLRDGVSVGSTARGPSRAVPLSA